MYAREFFKGKRVTVQGLGLNGGGVGTVRFLVSAGAKEIIVTDLKDGAALAPALARVADIPQVTLALGGHRMTDFTEVDAVVKNPTVPWTDPFIVAALEKSIPVTMDSAIFFSECPAPIIGVTGSKGKTTTSALIAHLLEQAGHRVVRAGVSQVSVLGVLSEVTTESVVVFELSSWRLSALSAIRKSPRIAVMTNIYRDHLNYYGTMEAYVADKKNIYRFQEPEDVLVTNYDNEWTRGMIPEAPGRTVSFSQADPSAVFGVTPEGAIVESDGGERFELLHTSDILLPGRHNVANVLAAVAAVRAYGVPREKLRAGVRSFSGVPHRLEFVGEVGGIRYYNDSAATIPDAALSALESFDRPVVLIAGGNDKNLDFTVFAGALLERAHSVVFLPGGGTDVIRGMLGERAGAYPVVSDMTEAVREATRRAAPGSIVLLSPGATSFGLFQNEFDRGERFKQAVQTLVAGGEKEPV